MGVLKLFENWLEIQGFHYEYDEDGDIRFQYYGLHLFCSKKDDEPRLLRFFIPGVYKVENNRVEVLEAINVVLGELSVIKAFLVDDLVYISLDLILDNYANLNDFVERYLGKMLLARNRIAEIIFEDNYRNTVS